MNLNHSHKPYAPPDTNLVDRLRYWSKQQPSQPAFYYLGQQEQVTQLTYSELYREARAIAVQLTEMGLNGERALLLYPPGLDFVAAFFGCLFAGTTAVPALPPRRNRNMARVEAISENAQAAVVLSVQEIVERSAIVLDNAPHLKQVDWLATDQISGELANEWFGADLYDDTLAVLQYTSGSTGQPKGVMLTHANLMHNCSLITYGFAADRTSLGLSWLPTYHDMGLIGGVLNPLYVGRPNVLMSPMSFLQKPIRWLRGISKFNVTISGGPNFAYALCNEKITDEDCEGLDLSSWKVAYNGAEPIRAETLAKFSEKFEPYGFRAESHYPCYGMAETTLIVSGADCRKRPVVRSVDAKELEGNRVVLVSDGASFARQLVASGQILSDQQVLIVDPVTCEPLSTDQVGEIWVRSDSVAQGYWNNEEETKRAFQGRLANRDNGQFLRTGDLGFFHGDQLFVTGRTKDLIIINGRNLYPHDIESIAEQAHEAIRIGSGVAFSTEIDNSEQLVIAQELDRGHRKHDTREITAAVRKAVFEILEVTPHTIVLLKTGSLPKTSSGKVQRQVCREKYLAGQLDTLAQWRRGEESEAHTFSDVAAISRTTPATTIPSASSIESWLVHRIANRLKTPPAQLDVNESFAHFGLDSVALLGISGELEDWMGCSVSPKLLFNYPTIAELSSHLATSLKIEPESAGPKNKQAQNALIANGIDDPEKLFETDAEPSASRILANLDKMSESDIDEMLKKMLNLNFSKKRELLKKLLQEESGREITNHPLSYGQRALWFIYQMDRNSSAYNIMYATRVNAGFDRAAFCRAFQTILDRHEILRTTYSMLDGMPTQKVHPRQAFQMQTLDARDWQQEKLDATIESVADEPFDLENGPIIRVQLFERKGNHHVLLFTVHHIALDFWSFDLLFDELELLHREETTGRKSDFSQTGIPYADFVRRQQQIMDGKEGQRQWEYWHKQLEGKLPVLDLPTDYPRPPLQSYRGKSFDFDLGDDLSRKLMDLSKSQDATLFATFLAAFQVLLYRYSGQDDILVGSPTAGRNLPEFENVLGYFLNPIVLRAKLSAEETFTSFLGHVRKTLVGGITNQDYPFPMLVERLQAPRDASRSPIFQVAIGWDKPRKLHLDQAPDASSNGKPVNLASLGLEPFALRQQGSAFDLMLMVLHADDSVSAAFQYNLDLFDESTIVRMVGHFQNLLESIVDNPERPLADLKLLNKAEENLLLEDWNDTAVEFPRPCCLHEMFEAQVRQKPDAIAVQCNGQQLTYRELNKLANQVAHYLASLEVGPDVLVGVYLDRSIEMIVGLLGVLKAGGAYVPLSPGTPAERLAFQLEESQATVVLTRQKLADDLPKPGRQIVCLDSDWTKIAKQDNTDRPRQAEPSNLAYVIFTSGSTGKPKGVQIEHRAVVNFLSSMQQKPGINSDDVLLAVTTFTFDISVLELFLPLTVGAKVVMVCPGVAADGVQLADAIADSKATIMQATPTTWRLLVEAGWMGDQQLKILCGGEAFPPDLAEQLLGRCSSLWNMYGPTETTIWSAIDRVRERSDPMPIGRPIANTQIFILDRRRQPVPCGVTGDLYIGGEGLARGYLNQPELTAEKFVDDPFRRNHQAKLYKTGDLARFRADGKIEFLGREDFQVKVRGFRIELGEIESRLSDHPAIRQTVVMARECSSRIDDKQLIAYFTHHDVPNTSDLRDYLKQELPDYMLPSMFVPLDELPLNPVGKVDRQALPAPDTARPDLRASFVRPRNDVEEKLAEIWARVLGLDEVGIEDNFFDLGGASMQSLEITTLAHKVGIEILPASLFKHPTIAELSASGLSCTNEVSSDESDIAVANSAFDPIEPQIETTAPLVEPQDTASSETRKTNIIIESIGVYLPPKSASTDEVVAGCKNKIGFPLEEMTGINSRRVADEDEFTSDLASHAVAECLDNSKYTPDQIDLVICCHIGRYESARAAALEPGTAMYLKQRFRFPNAIAFDVSNACAGMFTGISIAESYINSGAARRVMLVSAEQLSPVTTTAQQEISDFMDPRIACLTLGDAAAAILLEASLKKDVGFHELEMYSLSKYSWMCVGQPTEQEHGGPILVVPDPIKHTTVAIENSIAHSKHVLDRSSWKPEMMQHVIMHQTSERSLLDGARAINETFQRKICTPENTINNLSQRGNTASTSHFVAVWDNILNGHIKSGDNVFFAITGSGQTIGTGIYTFDDLPDRIRKRTELGHTAEKAKQIDKSQSPVSISPVPRIRAASVGVLSPETKVPTETMPMVKEAVENCLAKSIYDGSEIDLVLFAGVYRTKFISEPALATMIAGELKINDNIKPTDQQRTFAFDVINGGVGFLSACDIAAQMIRSKKIRTALIIASEIENNREHYPDEVFGLQETASAIILDQADQARIGFGEFVFKYLPEHLEARVVTGKYMNGKPCVYLEQDPSIADLFLKIIPEAVDELLKREGLSMSEISIVLPPQFSTGFLTELGRVLNIPRERFVDLVGDGKDWFTSALPYTLHRIETEGLAKPGEIGLVINVGSGLQVGCAIYNF